MLIINAGARDQEIDRASAYFMRTTPYGHPKRTRNKSVGEGGFFCDQAQII